MRFRNISLLLSIACVVLCHGHLDLDELISGKDSLIQLDSANPQLYLDRGELHRLHQDWKKASVDYRRADSLKPGWPAVAYCQSRMNFDRGEYTEALQGINSLPKVEFKNPKVTMLKGEILFKLKKYSEAQKYYVRSLKLQSSPSASLYYHIAVNYINIGDSLEACVWVERGLERLGNVDLLQELGFQLELGMKKYSKALRRTELQYQDRKNKVRYYFSRGKVFELMGDSSSSAMSYAQAFAAMDSIPARVAKSDAYILLRDSIQAGLNRLE